MDLPPLFIVETRDLVRFVRWMSFSAAFIYSVFAAFLPYPFKYPNLFAFVALVALLIAHAVLPFFLSRGFRVARVTLGYMFLLEALTVFGALAFSLPEIISMRHFDVHGALALSSLLAGFFGPPAVGAYLLLASHSVQEELLRREQRRIHKGGADKA